MGTYSAVDHGKCSRCPSAARPFRDRRYLISRNPCERLGVRRHEASTRRSCRRGRPHASDRPRTGRRGERPRANGRQLVGAFMMVSCSGSRASCSQTSRQPPEHCSEGPFPGMRRGGPSSSQRPGGAAPAGWGVSPDPAGALMSRPSSHLRSSAAPPGRRHTSRAVRPAKPFAKMGSQRPVPELVELAAQLAAESGCAMAISASARSRSVSPNSRRRRTRSRPSARGRGSSPRRRRA